VSGNLAQGLDRRTRAEALDIRRLIAELEARIAELEARVAYLESL
jgi:BMFP domain-containing protein YqiC